MYSPSIDQSGGLASACPLSGRKWAEWTLSGRMRSSVIHVTLAEVTNFVEGLNDSMSADC